MINTYRSSLPRLALLLALLLPGAFHQAAAQTPGVGIGTTAPDVSAALDIVSSAKGVLLPRVADATTIASPATGLIVFQTGGTAGFYYNAGTASSPNWQQIATVAGAAITASNGLTKTGQNLALGGQLSTPTTIPQAGNNFTLTGGSVGIGTNAPAATLDVSGDFRVSTGAVNSTLGTTVSGNANFSGGVGQSFTMPVAASITSVRLVCGATGFSTTFQIYSGSGPSGPALLATPVPITFTANASTTVVLPTPLSVAAGIYTVYLNVGSTPIRYFNSGENYPGGNVYSGTSSISPYDLDFTVAYTSGSATSALAVNAGGNVGIGTTGTPGARLDVTGGSIKISTTGQGLTFPDGSTQTTAATTATGAGFIQNGSTPQASSNFNISGAGTVGGLLTAGSAKITNLTTAGIVTTDASGNLGSASAASLDATTASNGLTKTSSDFTLGGTLTAATTTLAAGANTYAITQNATPITIAADQSDITAAATGGIAGNNFQNFTAGVTGTLTQVELQLNNTGGAVTNFTLTIWAGAGPGVTMLYSGVTSFTGTGYNTNYAFPVSAALSAGSVYTIQVTDPSGTTKWAINGSNPYPPGYAGYGFAYDFLFRTTMQTTGAAVTNWPVFTAKGGLIGIGTTTPGYTLDVNGPVRCTTLIQTSDARLKQDVRPIGQALASVQAMRGVRYTFRRAEFPAKQLPQGEQLGFLAQEVEKIYPELVSTDAEGFKAVNYAQLTPVLLEAIKEQQAQIEVLKVRAAQADTDHASLVTMQAQLARLLGSDGQAQK